jgi:2-succinyl-5-enolpyruvyl-6-hydroxy-3-cyclohexene-1-carboxylate synthase
LLSKSALHWLEGCARVLHILEGYAEVPRWPHALAVWGDMAQILHRLADGVAPAGAGPVALPAVWQRAEAEHCDWSAREAGRGFFGGSIIRTLCSTLPDGSAVLVGNSLLSRQLEDYGVAASRDVHIFGQRGLNGIDGNIAGFLGLSAAWPAERVVVGLIGDLAFLHNCSALMLSAMLEPICGRILIVVDNGGGGIFDTLPIARAQPGIFGEYFRFNHGWDVSAWADAAEIPCVRVSSVGEFGQALAESYKKPLLQMIWCRVDADLR